MKKFLCSVCGYVHEGNIPQAKCPQCGATAEKFKEQETGPLSWADELVIGVAKNIDAEVIEGLKAKFTGECTEVGIYLATSAKELNLDAIHDTVHEMCKDEARHGAAFSGPLKRYFGQ